MARKKSVEPMDELNDLAKGSKASDNSSTDEIIKNNEKLEEDKIKLETEKSKLEEEIKELKLQKETLINGYRFEALKELQKETEDLNKQKGINDAKLEQIKTESEQLAQNNEIATKAQKDLIKTTKENTESIMNEAKKSSQALIDTVKENTDAILAHTKSESKKIIDDANEHRKTQNALLNEREQELLAREKSLNSKENDLNTRELNISKREDDASKEFSNTLATEKNKIQDEINQIKLDKATEQENYLNKKKDLGEELAEYKKNYLVSIDKEIEDRRKALDIREGNLNDRDKDLAKDKEKLEKDKLKVQAQLNAYTDLVNNQPKELAAKVDERLKQEHAGLINENNTLKETIKTLNTKNSTLNNEKLELNKKLINTKGSEIETLKAEKDQLNKELEAVKNSNSSLINTLIKYQITPENLVEVKYKLDNFDDLLSKHSNLMDDYHKLEADYNSVKHLSDQIKITENERDNYKDHLNSTIDELNRMKYPTREERMSALVGYDKFNSIKGLRNVDINETEWLNKIENGLKESQIEISKRLLYAFHTSIKIHDWSPLVVLAGVSGTGKSELPRQYATYGGFNFLSVAVKPDWDSMESLFGYYNSIENKFEPTELCRALYVMDEDPALKDTMLIVLLDEMNLAHVELYFSDLLSKYETIRSTDNAVEHKLPLGAKEEAKTLNIRDNVLWVGTMNEDETTKALSDKVLDRSTLITFPRPEELKSRDRDVKLGHPDRKVSLSKWREWCKQCLTEADVKQIDDKLIDKTRKVIEDINRVMSGCNRNLGHRVWQSIERYIFSHPLVNDARSSKVKFVQEFNHAFAEAVAFKVMPKLRGIEVSGESKKVLESIKQIIDNPNNGLSELSEDFNHAMTLSSRIFQWCSAKFMK